MPSCASLATATVPPLNLVPPLKVLAPVSVSVPVPVLVNEPVPESTPAYVPDATWSKISVALLAMLPCRLVVFPCSAPALTVVPPV